MAFERLSYTKSWKNAADFPAYEPNETQVRADLQCLHDEARDGINRLIDALNAANAAAQLPFAPVEGLTARTVQAAIEEVFGAVTDAAAAKIVNGSVSREKLEAALLKRVYGGRVWVSLDEPGEAHRPETDFPVGQLWLRPACTITNLAKEVWTVDGGTVEAKDDGWRFTTDGTRDYLTASQLFEAVGTAAQRVVIRLCLGALSSHLNEVKLYLNGMEYDAEENGCYETVLDAGGSLEVILSGQWPYAEDGEIIEITSFAAVNTGSVESALPDCAPCSDWAGLLESLGSFETCTLPMTLWLQTAAGQWQTVAHAVLPVSRGGTGLPQVESGALLYGTGGEALAALPAVEQGILQWSEGTPRLLTPDTFVKSNRFLRCFTGTYQGCGGTEEVKVELGLREVPRMVVISALGEVPQTVCLTDGGGSSGDYELMIAGANMSYKAWVTLSEGVLTFFHEVKGNNGSLMQSLHMNDPEIQYRWVAICDGEACRTEEAGEKTA